MIGQPTALTVRKNFERPTRQQMLAFNGISTGVIADSQNGTGALDKKIKPVDGNKRFVGPAITAHTEPRDYLPVQPALALSKPGDVLVIATGAYEGAAVIGDNIVAMAKNKGLAAIVTDGLVRDVEGIMAVGLPVFCAGVSPNSPYARGPGSVGTPVGMSRSIIEAGDLIIGDLDGVVVVPRNTIAAVLSQLESVKEKEKDLEAQIKDGLCYAPWVDEYLQSDRTEYLD